MRYNKTAPHKANGEFAKQATQKMVATVKGLAFRAYKAGLIKRGHLLNVLKGVSGRAEFQNTRAEITRLQAILNRAAAAAPAAA